MSTRGGLARAALPYGAVMATGGASQLARSSGLHPLALPLLWLAVAEAVTIALLGLMRSRSPRGGPGAAVAPEKRFGDFTVPVGLAVIGTGLARIGGRPAQVAATAAVALAWLATLAVASRVAVPVVARRRGLGGVDGAWFLAPAALLADAIGAADVSGFPFAARQPFEWLALVACGSGFAAYWLVAALAAGRVKRFGTCGTARAPWWISAGCGGLAAAAVGGVAGASPVAGGATGFEWAALAAWAAGSVLAVPVLASSTVYILRLRRLEGSPPWPPTFSTAVYALGAGEAGRLSHAHAITTAGRVAGLATVSLWLATAGLYAALFVAHVSRPGRG